MNLGELCTPTRSGHSWCEPDNGSEEAAKPDVQSASGPGSGFENPVQRDTHASPPSSPNKQPCAALMRSPHRQASIAACAPPPRAVYESYYQMSDLNGSAQVLSDGGVCRRGQGIPEVFGTRPLTRQNKDSFQIEARDILTSASGDGRLDDVLESLSLSSTGHDGRQQYMARSGPPHAIHGALPSLRCT
jgi:hypothetical protein